MAKPPTPTKRVTGAKRAKSSSLQARTKAHSSGVLSKKIIQVLPLRVSDGFDEAFVTPEQSSVVKKFIDAPARTTAIQYDDPALATVPIGNLFKSNSLLPRVNNPTNIRLALADVVKLFSTREIHALGRKWDVKVDKAAISRLVHGKATSIVGSDGENIGVFRVSVANQGAAFATSPIADEVLLLHKDLATFLENPTVPGTRQLPYKINLSEAELMDFLSIGAVTINVNDKKTFSIVVVSDDTTDAKSGLSFRRDIWTPTQIEHLFGVTTKGYLSSSKDIEQAASDDFNALLSKMRSNLDKTSVRTTRFSGEQLAIMLPWRQDWTFEGEAIGVRKQTVTLLPQETRVINSNGKEATSSPEHSLSHYVDFLLTSDQEILNSNASSFVNVGSPLTLTKQPGAKKLESQALALRCQSFSVSLNDKISGQSIRAGANSTTSGQIGKTSKTWVNTNNTSLLELTEYQSLNRFKVETTSIPTDMSLGYMIENPFLDLPLNTDTIMRYQNIFMSALLEKDLTPGFQTIGRVVKRAQIMRFSASQNFTRLNNNSKVGRNQEIPSTITDKEFDLIKLQRKNLEDRLKSILQIVQKTSLELLDPNLVDKTCETIAGIGDSNAARILGLSKGSASVDAISKCRLFVSRQLYERKFPALFNVISEVSQLNAADLEPRIWGESFASAVPTPFDIFDLVNLSNEPLREIKAIYEPLIAPMTQTASDLEQWWAKLGAMSMTIPSDNGLARAIERFLISYDQLLRFDSGDFDIMNYSKDDRQKLTDQSDEDLYMARRLIRHIQDNTHYYIGQIFAGQSHRQRITMLRSAIEVKVPEVRHEAFDFNRVRICGSNIVIGLNPDMINCGSDFLSELNKGPSLKSTLSVDLPVTGVCVRGRAVKLSS